MTYPDMAAQRMQITAEIADLLERQDLIIKLGKALVRTGAPSYRIEAALEKTSKRLEVNGSYFVLPGLIMVSFGDEETHTSETHLIKCAKSLDLAKLETVNDIARKVYKGHLDVVEANDLLDNIKNSPPTWGFGMTLVGYVLSSAFIAPLFFNGSWTDCWVSGIFGLCVGIATFISERVPMLNNVFEMAITIVVSVIVLALSPNVCYLAVSLSAVVVALPGYSLTSAVMELAAKNLCSGTVHLAHALMYVLFLAFGMSYGSGIWHLSHGDDMTSGANNVSPLQTCMNSVDPYWFFLILPLTCLGILICYGGSLRQYPGFTLNSAVGFVLYFFLNKRLGTSTSASNITSSVCAFAIGVVSNIYARITKNTTNHIHFAIVILVPGSLGVRGAFNLFDGNSSNGSDFVIQIIGIALSITLGLFLANVCVYPNGRKRSVFLGF
ncbi:DUF1212-domain-containing protein [Hesseltinella vesiculosa]|uniref:DUF1212-domain-containing protein n=1 Tax=Hesseltinella vesiculosa TaxID=101127 RepID=A0A1X2G532_9FUNG|nr:DUF1212-domain-containing protein [Hesseltinella vesiculosa]